MAIDTTMADVVRLRAAGLTPKRIARQLGLPLPVVARLVADIAAERTGSADLLGCWVSPGWSRELVVPAHRQWPDGDPGRNDATGIVAVLVARQHRYDKVGICGYLVDVHCLGVKNAIGPRILEPHQVHDFAADYFGAFDGEPVPAPLDLAQHLVFGAIAFAGALGFEPHNDFAKAAAYLGDWQGPSAITFGRDGKPFYVQGPYDDSFSIMQKLNRTVGRGNYDFMVEVGWPPGRRGYESKAQPHVRFVARDLLKRSGSGSPTTRKRGSRSVGVRPTSRDDDAVEGSRDAG